MKRYILTVLSALLVLSSLASAQALRGSYFFETSLMRGKMNAAFAPQNNFVSLPLLGSAGSDSWSNVGLRHFVFPSGNEVRTFMHEGVSAESFLEGLPAEDPYLKSRFEMDLIGAGLRLGEKGFLTVSLGVAGDVSALVPNEFLRFAKTGADGSYPGPVVSGNTYGVLSVGYSYDLSQLVEGLRFGARIKLLSGLYAGSLDLRQANVRIQADEVAVSTDGGGYLVGMDWNNKKIQVGNFGLRGFGFGVDLGFEYQFKLDGFINGVNISASVNDLGRLGYKKDVHTLTTGASASFTGFQGINADYDFKANLDRVVDDFSRLADVSSSPASGYDCVLTPSIYAGLEIPFLQERMSVGVLYYQASGFKHVMASYNLSPLRWLNLSLNGTFLGARNTYGFYAEFIPKKWVGVFFGMEKASLKTNKQHIPIDNFTESACLGVNIVFGGK